MTPPLIQNSAEHIAAVQQIDLHYNRRLQEAKRDFLLRHPGMAMDECEDWKSIEYEIESLRQYDFGQLKKRIADLQPVVRPPVVVDAPAEAAAEPVEAPGQEPVAAIAPELAEPVPAEHV